MNTPPAFPVTDSHIHLDPNGKGVEAIREFEKEGGTHIILVSKPYIKPDKITTTEKTIIESYHITLKMAEKVRRATEVKVFVVLGPHPSELTKLVKHLPLKEAEEVMKRCLEKASEYIKEGDAVAFGEVGRPHYPCSKEIFEASNRILEYAMALGKDLKVPLVLHTESGTKVFKELSEMAEKIGFPKEKLIRHFSKDYIELEVNFGLFPSVIARESTIKKALQKGTRFTMETDYIDVLSRPSVVLPPYQVPRVTKKLFKNGLLDQEAWHRIHKENIEYLYNIKIDI